MNELTDHQKLKIQMVKFPNAYKFKVTTEQYANAKTHWEALIEGKLPGGFDMCSFVNKEDEEEAITEKNVCGTCACSAGYLPYTLALSTRELSSFLLNSMHYLNYPLLIETKLGMKCTKYTGLGLEDSSDEFMWCFAAYWELSDNTAKGAGIRMRILYEEGLPLNWEEQMNRGELMYENEMTDVR